MPVYNGAGHIERALDSLLEQSFTDFELIIADNASTDDTQRLCQKFALSDCRIRYLRHTENRGALKNFLYVLNQARGKYFMWAAADDYWLKEYLLINSSFLDKEKDYIASTTQCMNIPDIDRSYLESDEPSVRFEKLIGKHKSNHFFYSVFRRRDLVELINGGSLKDFRAADWHFVDKLALAGK